MGSTLFDNILKTLRLALTYNAGTIVSGELDFDIPRGFLVKIHDVSLENRHMTEDFEGISVDKLARATATLIKDPDDTASFAFPNNTVDHDVLMTLVTEIIIIAGTAGDTGFHIGRTVNNKNFNAEGLDVFTARNMRLNIVAQGTDLADITETLCEVLIDYTLEKISNEDIINLLDIL